MEKEYRDLLIDRSNEIVRELYNSIFDVVFLHSSIIITDVNAPETMNEEKDELKDIMLTKLTLINALLFDYKQAISLLKINEVPPV